MCKTRPPKKRGAAHLKADGVEWVDAMKHALGKPKPKEAWGPNKQ
jgi:hypothetical protein